jgi:hypothetical protein
VRSNLGRAATAWAQMAAQRKGIEPDSPLTSEEWHQCLDGARVLDRPSAVGRVSGARSRRHPERVGLWPQRPAVRPSAKDAGARAVSSVPAKLFARQLHDSAETSLVPRQHDRCGDGAPRFFLPVPAVDHEVCLDLRQRHSRLTRESCTIGELWAEAIARDGWHRNRGYWSRSASGGFC